MSAPLALSANPFTAPLIKAETGSPRIGVLKGDRLYVDGVCRLLTESFEGADVRGSCCPRELAGWLEEEPADLLLSGLNGMGDDIFRVMDGWRKRGWVRRILVFSGRMDTLPLLDAMALPVDGILDASQEGDVHLVAAIRQVLTGSRYYSQSVTRRLAALANNGERPDHILTPSERRVLLVIGGGYDDTDAARRLDLSPHTVRKHRETLYRKLGVHSRKEFIEKASGWMGVDR